MARNWPALLVLAIFIAGCSDRSPASPFEWVEVGGANIIVPCPAGSGWNDCEMMTSSQMDAALLSMFDAMNSGRTNDDCNALHSNLSTRFGLPTPVMTFGSHDDDIFSTVVGERLPDGTLGFRRDLFGPTMEDELARTGFHESTHLQAPDGGPALKHGQDDEEIEFYENLCAGGGLA